MPVGKHLKQPFESFQPNKHCLPITQKHSGSVPWCCCCQAHRGCRPLCHTPGGWTGRCWAGTPCTGCSLSRCSVLEGRAHRTSQTAQSPGHRPGRKRPLHPRRWSLWWSRSWPCHWWTVCSGTRAKETTLVSSHRGTGTPPTSLDQLIHGSALPHGLFIHSCLPGRWEPLTPCKKPVSFDRGQEFWQWVSKECCVVKPHT